MTVARRLGAAWGIVGVVLILGDAMVRVWPYARDGLRHGLTAVQWALLVAWVLIMVVAEGYRGFQQRFSPRVASRREYLLEHGHGIDLVLAPLYCIGYFHAARRQVISSCALTTGIVVLIVVVHTFSQPWRGIVDAGVLAGLGYGLVSVVVVTARSRVRTIR